MRRAVHYLAAFLAVALIGVWLHAATTPAVISVDYPPAGSIFPPDITAPTVLFRDPSPATTWKIDVELPGAPAIHAQSAGERMQIGEIDPETVSDSNQPPQLTPLQAQAHTWIPDGATWESIKSHSPAKVHITGLSGSGIVSQGDFVITTSKDPVAAPIFYRDVPLMPNQSEKGVVKPLPANAVGLIKWRLRYINEPKSHVVMERLGTCANCHSFSLDGKTLGLDVDGPQNDRGLYALVKVQKQMAIRNQDVIKWPIVRDPKVPRLRAAFMSQVSPDGRFVVTTIDDPGAAQREGGESLEDKYYNANFMDYRFLQVFYPTRGILAWYSRETGRLEPLPGANDPRYVQTDGVWSPDGKYIVFARAEAKSPYPPGAKLAMFANDPNETQIQYNLYRVPFNDGKGGRPERIIGASENGMSNNFPKVSPDGKWIVFVRCRNGQLMRPDSKLCIVPFSGGKERLMNCNTPLMNSWHTFSPNGHWLAFSSKSWSPYTKLFLTHIDENGNDSPAILIQNSTAANRAVNLPEFVNLGPGGIDHIAAPATDFYKLMNTALELMQKGKFAEAVPKWHEAVAMEPADSRAHFNLAHSLNETGQTAEAIPEYQKACELDPKNSALFANLGLALAHSGKLDESIAAYRTSVTLNPANAEVQGDFGVALFEAGRQTEALEHLVRAVALEPESAEAHNKFGSILAKSGKPVDAVAHLAKAVALNPSSEEYQFNLAYVLGQTGDFEAAVTHMEKAVEISGGRGWQSLAMLGAAYYRAGRVNDAVEATRRALAVAEKMNNAQAANSLRAAVNRYLQHTP